MNCKDRPSILMLILVVSVWGLPGCQTATPVPQAQTVTPTRLQVETAPVTFNRLVIRVPAGTDIGGHHEGLAKIRQSSYTWGSGIQLASDEFKIIASETLDRYGFNVLGGDNLLFGSDESGKADYQIGGTVTDLAYNTYGMLAGDKAEAWVDIEWQVYDALSERTVFTASTEGTAEHGDPGTGVQAVKDAFRAALTNLIGNEQFVSQVRQRSEFAATGYSEQAPVTVQACDSPAAGSLPADTEEAFQAIPIVRVGGSMGTGVIVSPDGHMVTAAHVVSGRERADVLFRSGLELTAEVVRTDPAQDVALMKLPGRGHSCLTLSKSTSVPVGSDLFVVGNPEGEEQSFSVARGVVSGHRDRQNFSYLQTDASVNRGNSGGPMLNRQGQIIGIVSFKIVGQGVEGLGFGVPPDALTERLNLTIR